METDVSYTIHVDAVGEGGGGVRLAAPTVFGLLYALETLSQLVVYVPASDEYEVENTPLALSDAPRFPYRGVLVDVARHFMPVKMLERVVDAMSAAKLNVRRDGFDGGFNTHAPLSRYSRPRARDRSPSPALRMMSNATDDATMCVLACPARLVCRPPFSSAIVCQVLHLHLSDVESSPAQSERFPLLWNSAFSTGERYATRELARLVRYALERGVAILPEVVTPRLACGSPRALRRLQPHTPSTRAGGRDRAAASVVVAPLITLEAFFLSFVARARALSVDRELLGRPRAPAAATAAAAARVHQMDTPSHSKSLCAGAPPTVCMAKCTASNNWPLRPVERTFGFLAERWAELDGAFSPGGARRQSTVTSISGSARQFLRAVSSRQARSRSGSGTSAATRSRRPVGTTTRSRRLGCAARS